MLEQRENPISELTLKFSTCENTGKIIKYLFLFKQHQSAGKPNDKQFWRLSSVLLKTIEKSLVRQKKKKLNGGFFEH